MSFDEARGKALLAPLRGRTTTFLMDGRRANASFARVLARSLEVAKTSCTVLDLDAFYSSNADRLFRGGNQESDIELRVPTPGADVGAEFASLFEAKNDSIVIDSLNTLYHLISAEDGRSRGRKVMFAFASMSQFARTNGKAVIMGMYRREGFGGSGRVRSIANLSDVTASVQLGERGVEIRTEKGAAWEGGAFFSPVP